MIEFLTLFLGIVVGPQTVTLVADDRVAAIEIQLDGQTIERIEQPPWKLTIDLGPDLAPHVLEAIASDADGQAIGHAVQLLNVPRSPAEAHLHLERDGNALVTAAHLSWESSVSRDPLAVTATLDGQPLEIEDSDTIDLRGIDSNQFHFLQAELIFPGRIRATTQITFGGEHLDTANAELTSLPVIPRSKGKQPKLEEMESWFRKDGEPLRVVAVDKGLAEIVAVRGPGVASALANLPGLPGIEEATRATEELALGAIVAAPSQLSPVLSNDSQDALRHVVPLANDKRLQLLEARSRRYVGQRLEMDTFAISPEISHSMGGLYWALTQEVSLAGLSPRLRVNDALAVAALHAAYGNRRRAVLLVLAEPWEEESRLKLADVRAYMQHLNVPLVVWVIGDQAIPTIEGTEVERATSFRQLQKAKKRLSEELDLQRIVWLEGRHLPTSIQVSATAAVVPAG